LLIQLCFGSCHYPSNMGVHLKFYSRFWDIFGNDVRCEKILRAIIDKLSDKDKELLLLIIKRGRVYRSYDTSTSVMKQLRLEFSKDEHLYVDHEELRKSKNSPFVHPVGISPLLWSFR
jgi:hypothetical protein